ncbi:hypothetical protein FO519_000207 [Halicephalobus sp. NKZ332]|nr:hypothetical protein FO519_000207 [Halicephalobus sp. NKZ332]
MEYVGERVDVNGHKGRVMYYGPIEGKPDLYLGIDWEDPERGKHDGTVNGIRYFQASKPTSGSFVALKSVSFGEDFVKSFLSHYVVDCDPEGGLTSDSRLNRDIEFVQRDKYIKYVRNFDKLFSVSLINSSVKYFKSADIAFPNCTALILSKSLIYSWETLTKITSLFPVLRLLDISHNHMELLSEVENLELCVHTPKIRALNADNCGLDNESVSFSLFS